MELRPFPRNMPMQDESGKSQLKYGEALKSALKLNTCRVSVELEGKRNRGAASRWGLAQAFPCAHT